MHGKEIISRHALNKYLKFKILRVKKHRLVHPVSPRRPLLCSSLTATFRWDILRILFDNLLPQI